MIRNITLVILMLGASFVGCPFVAWSQNTEDRSVIPKETVKRANDQLNQFIVTIERTYHLSIKFTAIERERILTKYLRETDSSPYFWKYLYYKLINKVPNEEERYAGNARNQSRTGDAARAAVIQKFMVRQAEVDDWGMLILSSEPSGADVFLRISSTRTQEGRTRIRRKYPEGNYTFVIELTGYKSKQIYVAISKDNPVDKKVVLEKQ